MRTWHKVIDESHRRACAMCHPSAGDPAFHIGDCGPAIPSTNRSRPPRRQRASHCGVVGLLLTEVLAGVQSPTRS